MPRTVRRTQKVRRPTKWCAATSVAIVPNQAGLAIADGNPLCPSTTAGFDQADPVVGWCRGAISLSRVGVAEANPAVAWAIVLAKTVPGSITPLQTFNPWAVTELERQDILGMGHIPVPPTNLVPSTDARIADDSSTVVDINIRVGRKYPRNSTQLMLWIVSFGSEDVAYEAVFSIRTLMKFG